MEAEQDPNKPVAYDTEGRPLYLHPSDQPHPSDLEVVQVTRSTDPVAVRVSSQMKAKHDTSKAQYPHLNLSAGEFVILNIRRHPIGLFTIWFAALVAVLIIIVAWWFVLAGPGSQPASDASSSNLLVSAFALGLVVLVAVGGYIGVIVYRANNFILTSESVIQRVQYSLFSHQEKTINLENIKDARFDQAGIFQSLIGYGSLRLTTEGDQENYSFSYVADPKEQIATINNVIEAVKYGRPIDEALNSVST